MKTTNRALLVASMASALATGGCGRQANYLTAEGVLTPAADKCAFSPTGIEVWSEGVVYVGEQKALNFTPSYVLAMKLSNRFTSTSTQGPSGPIDLAAKNDVLIHEVDVEFTGDPGSTAIPSEVLKYDALIPVGGAGDVIVELFSGPVAVAMGKVAKSSKYYVSLVFKGETQSGSKVETDPYVFGLNVVVAAPDCGENPPVAPAVLGTPIPFLPGACGFQEGSHCGTATN